MSINFLVYGVLVYFVSLLGASFLALVKKYLRQAQLLFVGANALGFLLGISYFANFAGKSIVLANFSALFGFAPTLNLLSAIFFTVISFVAGLVGIYGIRYLELYQDTYDQISTQFLTALFVAGMQGVLFANNAFVFLLFWEVMSIASFFLVLAAKSTESSKAAFLYFVMTHLGASAILGGFLILSGGNLLFDFANLAGAAQALPHGLAILSFSLFFFGFGSKAGLVPFHVWLPEAHPEAPSNVSALMSGLMLKVAIFGFIKIAFSFMALPSWVSLVVIGLGLLSAVLGVLFAVVERDMKRSFAYSSIENMGLIFTMLGLALYLLSQSSDGSVVALSNAIVAFAIFHAISHALFKTALFLSSGVVISRVHTRSLELMGGIAKIMPFFSFAFLLATLASLPLPPFSTFFGEWGLIQSIVSLLRSSALNINAMVVLIVVLSVVAMVGGLAAFAMIKVFGISMLGLPRAKHLDARAEKTDYLLIAPILVLSLATIAVGVFARPLITWLVASAGQLSQQTSASAYVSKLSSGGLFFLALISLLFAWVIKRQFVKENKERTYQTWDCGQPIDASMEYTATAFSAPIRFFYMQLLGFGKVLKSTRVVQTNPWITKNEFSISFKSLWAENLYKPVAKTLNLLADKLKAIQGGRIQYYLLFVLGTLILTLIIFL